MTTGLMYKKIFIIALVLFTGIFCSQSHAALKNAHIANLDPGNYMGFSLQLTASGTLYRPQDKPDNSLEPRSTHASLGSVPGLNVFFEKLTKNGVLTPGFSLGMRFNQFSYQKHEDFKLNTEFQVTPYLKLYFTDSGLFRPYMRMSAGLSLGRNYGLGINTSGSLGVLFKTAESKVAFFTDIGVEGVFLLYSPQEQTETGTIRQILFSCGIAF